MAINVGIHGLRGIGTSVIQAAIWTVESDAALRAKVMAWYDNEWGYSSRCVDLVRYMASRGL